jgi:hypothetical protein
MIKYLLSREDCLMSTRNGFFLIVVLIMLCPMGLFADKVEYVFSDGPTVVPVEASLAGTVDDWALLPNPDNAAPSETAANFAGGFLTFTDNADIAGNLGLETAQKAELREGYKLSGPGDRLWIVCDHKMIKYGHRSNLASGSVDGSRAQLFWVSFLTSTGEGIGLQYAAGNYNSDGNVFFTALGNGTQSQDDYLTPNYLIEEGAAPNLNRRVVIIRITESPVAGSVIVDVKYDDQPYQRISNAYADGIVAYPAGNITGDENVLVCVGNFSGSGAIEFEMHGLTLTDTDPAPGSIGADDPIGVRQLAASEMHVGDAIDIGVDVYNLSDNPKTALLAETIPDGFTATSISHGGSVSGNQIVWNLTLEPSSAGPATVTYTLQSSDTLDTAPLFSGTLGEAPISGPTTLKLWRKLVGRTPRNTGWNPPAGGWSYIYDPDLGSPEDITLDGWSHDNGSDEYVFQPTLTDGPNAGQVWKNPAFIDDEDFGGKALRIDDVGDPRSMGEYLLPDPGLRKITLNYDLGQQTKGVCAFRIRSLPHTNEFGTEVPFGYPDADEYPLLGLVINRGMTDLTNWDALSGSGLYFSPALPESLNFPNFGTQPNQYIWGQYDDNWNNYEWHEYWITWNITEGEKATALYVDGQLVPKFSFPLSPGHPDYLDDPEFIDAQNRGAFFNRARETDAGVPEGNLVFRITFRNTGDAGTMDFDYIAMRPGTDEGPTAYVAIDEWSLY